MRPLVSHWREIRMRRGVAAALELVKLAPLMARSEGAPETTIALVDGPVANHPALAGADRIAVGVNAACKAPGDYACSHGTFVAGVLVASRDSGAPGIAPRCRLIVRPIFREGDAGTDGIPNATPRDLADAIRACVSGGARAINISAAVMTSAVRSERALDDALDEAAKREVIVVAAAGNQGQVAGSALTRHPWVLAVAACDVAGRPLATSNFGRAIGNGLLAPGDQVESLRTGGGTVRFSGSSVAAPFVTGTAALLLAMFPNTTGSAVRSALLGGRARRSIVPPILNAWAAYESLSVATGDAGRRRTI